jgi:trans-aconitate 2-methyltransferase
MGIKKNVMLKPMNKYFEFDGKKYQKASTHQKEWGNAIIDELHLKGDEKILDLGCGDGAVTTQLARCVPNGLVIGIDASKGMLESANKLIIKNLKFQEMNINSLNLNYKFNLIFSNATLHWIKDHQLLLNNVYAHLSDNGQIRFNFAADGNCSHYFQVIEKLISNPNYKKYFTNYTWPWYMPNLKEYEQLLENINFTELKVWGENKDRYFDDRNQMIAWIDQPSIVPFLKEIPDKKTQKQFRDDVVDKMIQLCEKADGRCFETFRRINVWAKKQKEKYERKNN